MPAAGRSAPGETAALFTTNDAAYASAYALAEAGAAVAAIIDPRHDSAAMQQAREDGFTVHAGQEVCGTIGGLALLGIRHRDLGSAGPSAALPADLLMISGGWNPAVHLASQSGAALTWDEAQQAFLPGAPVQRERSAGACRGVFGIAAGRGRWRRRRHRRGRGRRLQARPRARSARGRRRRHHPCRSMR